MIKSILSFPVQVFQYISNTLTKIKTTSKNPLQLNVLSFRSLINAVIVASVIYALYYFMEPFGIKEYASQNKTLLLIISASAGFLGFLIADFFLPAIFRSYFKISKWNISKEISLHILRFFFVGLLVMVIGNQTGLTNFNLPLFLLQFTGIGGLIGIVLAFTREKFLRNLFQTKADAVNERIQNYTPIQNNGNAFPVMVFSGSNDKVSLVPNQLISVKMDKYKSDLVYQNIIGTVSKTLDIASTDVLKEISSYGQFIQLRQNHFVNAQAVYRAEANAAGYFVHIAKYAHPMSIPKKYQKVLEKI